MLLAELQNPTKVSIFWAEAKQGNRNVCDKLLSVKLTKYKGGV